VESDKTKGEKETQEMERDQVKSLKSDMHKRCQHVQTFSSRYIYVLSLSAMALIGSHRCSSSLYLCGASS